MANQSLHFTITGSGPAVVLLHGFTESIHIWDSYAKVLSERFTVICIDLPGHGLSPTYSDEHSMEFMAQKVNEVLSQVSTCVLVGHSMGGYVALAFAELFSDKVAGLCLFHSTALPDSEEKKADRLRVYEVVKKDKAGFITSLIPKLFAIDNRETMLEVINQMKEISMANSSEGILASLLGMRNRKDRRDVLRTMNVPVLFIAGKGDELIPTSSILEQSAYPEQAFMAELKHSGHMGFVEEEVSSLLLVEQFIRVCFHSSK